MTALGVLFLCCIAQARVIERPLLSYLFTFQAGSYGDLSHTHPQRTANARFVRQLHWIDMNCRRTGISYEIVVAMWPVKENDTMRDTDLFVSLKKQGLELPPRLEELRLIHVPAEAVAQEIKNIPERLFVLEYVGKNIAARRARGRFLVLGGTDCLAHERFYDWLVTEQFNRSSVYGMHRAMLESDLTCDVSDFGCTVAQRERMAASGLISATSGHRMQAYLQTTPAVFSSQYSFKAAGDFTALTSDAMYDLRGYVELPNRAHVDSLFICQAQAAKKDLMLFHEPVVCFHQNHDRSIKIIDDTPLDWGAHQRSFSAIAERGAFIPVNPLHTWGMAHIPMHIELVRDGRRMDVK